MVGQPPTLDPAITNPIAGSSGDEQQGSCICKVFPYPTTIVKVKNCFCLRLRPSVAEGFRVPYACTFQLQTGFNDNLHGPAFWSAFKASVCSIADALQGHPLVTLLSKLLLIG